MARPGRRGLENQKRVLLQSPTSPLPGSQTPRRQARLPLGLGPKLWGPVHQCLCHSGCLGPLGVKRGCRLRNGGGGPGRV